MPQPFDATTKDLLEFSPEEWPRVAGLGTGKVEIIDADISTVSGATDKVIRVQAPRPSLLSIDFQSGPDVDAPSRMLVYNAVLGHRHKLPVRSLLVLLAPKADLIHF